MPHSVPVAGGAPTQADRLLAAQSFTHTSGYAWVVINHIDETYHATFGSQASWEEESFVDTKLMGWGLERIPDFEMEPEYDMVTGACRVWYRPIVATTEVDRMMVELTRRVEWQ